VANEQNLRPIQKGQLSSEEAKARGRNGGIKSGEARREKATMRETLKMMLEDIPIDEENKNKLTNRELATLGLIKGARCGNSANYKTMLEVIGELTSEATTTPVLKIEVSDNSKLEKVLYEENRSGEDVNK
jgi:hypothetical protein